MAVFPLLSGKGPTARSVHIDLPPIVIVAATTQAGKLSTPLRSRFSGGVLRLAPYSEEDIQKIVNRSARVLGVTIGDEAAAAIARRARSTPRTANYLLKRVRDYTQIHGTDITPETVATALKERDIDEYGLTAEDRHILTTIQETFSGGPVGIQALATTISEDPQTLEEVYEPFLIQTGFIERTPRGRSITEKGKRYLNTEE